MSKHENKLRPKIYWTWYPRMNRGFWRVSGSPRRWTWLSPVEKKRWKDAHNHVQKLNRAEDQRILDAEKQRKIERLEAVQ